ncbi:hypothetical protein C3941_05320 [Kaistia algarum]|uniref:hemerythrin domain-containing protein n=1 Tax=Kaistia algarum TaxID=2083279 RepID=UPI000CE88FF5|nr:hemerythrin domain-containing protein [Kaistia algarum]PPE80736.1 hypothetical protein C3941_05320 [Kaistia algarum]
MHATFPDLYGSSHIALRRRLAWLISAISAADDAASDGANAALNHFADFVDSQGESEAACLQPMLRIADPTTADRLDRQHGKMETRIAEIMRGIVARRAAPDSARGEAHRAVLRSTAALIADCRRHQTDEERVATPALANHFHPMALFAAERAIHSTQDVEPRRSAISASKPLGTRRERADLADLAFHACTAAFFALAERQVEAEMRKASRSPSSCDVRHRRRNRVRIV